MDYTFMGDMREICKQPGAKSSLLYLETKILDPLPGSQAECQDCTVMKEAD